VSGNEPEVPPAPGKRARTVVPKQRGPVPTPTEWQKEASGIVRSLIGRDNLRPEQVVDLLQKRGIVETDRGFKEKVANGTFSLAWFLQLIVAIERHPHTLVPELTLPAPDEALREAVRVKVEEQRARHSARARAGQKKGEMPEGTDDRSE
jgi:Domain of unknown function (DUF6471)